jgi:hypothetical protein
VTGGKAWKVRLSLSVSTVLAWLWLWQLASGALPLAACRSPTFGQASSRAGRGPSCLQLAYCVCRAWRLNLTFSRARSMDRNTALRLVLLAGAAAQQGNAETLLEGFRTLDYLASSFQNSQVRSLEQPLAITALQAWTNAPFRTGRYADVQAGASRRQRRQLPMPGADVQPAWQPVAARVWPSPRMRAWEGLRLDVQDIPAPGRKHRSRLDHHSARRQPGHDHNRVC